MKRTILFACMCVIILATTGYAKMGHGHGHGLLPPGKWWHMPKIVERLKITDDEKNFLDQMFLENRKAMIQVKSEMETKKLDMESIIEKEPLDENAAMTQFDSIQETGKKMWKNKFKFVIEVRKLLGKDRFMQLKSQFRKFHHGKHRHGKGRKGCLHHPMKGAGKGQMNWDENGGWNN